MSRSLYFVKCDVDQTGIGLTAGEVLVIAESKRDALDKTVDHPDVNPRRDDPVYDRALAIAQIEGNAHDSSDLWGPSTQVREATYVGEIDKEGINE